MVQADPLQIFLFRKLLGERTYCFFLQETDWGKEIQRSAEVLNRELLCPEKTPLRWRPSGVSDGDSKEVLGDGVWKQRITKGLRHTWDLSVLEGVLCALYWNGCCGCKNWECLYMVCQAGDCEAAVLKVSLVPKKILHVVWKKWPRSK